MEGPGGKTIAERAAGPLERGSAIGRYTILALVGQGDAGEVYAAYDPELDRKVALKLLRTDGGGDSSNGQDRLLREAKAMAKVTHPNVVSVHDAGTFGQHVFVAMDFVEGSTLRDWLAEQPRARDEILAVFITAADGLMAAHAAGLVHRDFKPANVLIGRDGSARVTDFGIARPLLGTPRYVAPEQLAGQLTDARTDQFGFCVALYEALYGVPPFGDGDLSTLTAAVLAGRVQPAPPRSAVPTWLRRVLVRGLSAAPEARWPSMRALVAALAHDPARHRRRWALAGAVSLLVAVPAVLLTRPSGSSGSLCRGGPARLAGVWETLGADGTRAHPRRDAIQRAFLTSGAPDAQEVWTRVAVLLDRYAAGWLAMYEDACVATHVRGVQPASILDLRMSCLDDRSTALVALTEVLAVADRAAVGRSIDAANALPGLERCGDVRELQLPVEPPRDEATRRRVADFRQRLAKAKALNDTGRHLESQAVTRAVIDEARALGYRPALAEALGELTNDCVGAVEKPDILPLAEEAFSVSLSVGRDDLAALAALARTGMSYQFATDVAECRHWLKLTHAVLDRAGAKQDRVRSWLLQVEAIVQRRENDLDGALNSVRQSIALKQRILPKGHPDIAIGQNAEAEVLHFMGRNDEALRINQAVYDVFSSAYGHASVEAALTLSNRGEYLLDSGRPAEALTAYQTSLPLWEAQLGTQHQNLAFPTTGIGRALLALGRPRDAVPPLERALRLRDPAQTEPELVAETQFALAQARVGSGGSQARAVALATKARDTYLQLGNEARAAAVEAWLAEQHDTRHAR